MSRLDAHQHADRCFNFIFRDLSMLQRTCIRVGHCKINIVPRCDIISIVYVVNEALMVFGKTLFKFEFEMPARAFLALGRCSNRPTMKNRTDLICITNRNRVRTLAQGNNREQAMVEGRYGWDLSEKKYDTEDPQVVELPVRKIRRPLQGSRSNDQAKVDALKSSIDKIGLLEPIDVLLVNGEYYGFSGCHRYQAHQELGKETILCRVRKATEQTLKFHMM